MNLQHDANNLFGAYSIQSSGYVADSKKFLIKEVASLGVGAVFHDYSGIRYSQDLRVHSTG
jgi:hypothetical protein